MSESKMILYQGYIISIHVLQEKRTTGPSPAPASAPPVVILDTSSSTATPPVQGFTFGFEVNEDLLKEKEEESLVGQDSNGDKGAVIPQSQNSDNDNIMMKNLHSLTSKSQDNDSNRSSEPLKSEAEVEEEVEEEEEEDEGELEKDKGVCLDLSRFHEEDIDIKKFNYDVILGFVSKGMSHIHYKQPKLMSFLAYLFLHFSLGDGEYGAEVRKSYNLLQFLGL